MMKVWWLLLVHWWGWFALLWWWPIGRFHRWRHMRNLVPLGAAIVVRQIVVDCAEQLDAPISGTVFSEVSMARLRIPVQAGDSVLVEVQNVGAHHVFFRACIIISCSDGALAVLPLEGAVLGPGEVLERVARSSVDGFLTRLLVPSLTNKVRP